MAKIDAVGQPSPITLARAGQGSGQNRGACSVTRLNRLLLMLTFCPLKYRIFHGIPAKDSGGATIEDTQVVVGCKQIKIYVRISKEKNTFDVHNANIKGKIV